MTGTISLQATEEIAVHGDELLRTVKGVISVGNARRIAIMDSDRQAVIDIPRTLGRADTTLDPVWHAVGALAALPGSWIVVVDRETAWPCAPSDRQRD